MPFESKAQMRWMRANHPKMAERWSKHTKDFKSLPEHVGDEKEGQDSLAQLAQRSHEELSVHKLAAAAEISPGLVHFLAEQAGMTPSLLVKHAYADPDDFINYLHGMAALHTGQPLEKSATMRGILTATLQKMRGAASGAVDMARKHPVASSVGALGAATAGTLGTRALMSKSTPSTPSASTMGGAAEGAASPPEPPAAPKPPEPPAGGGGMGKMLLAGGAGVGLGALGAGMLGRRKKKKEDKEASALPRTALPLMRKVIIKKAAALMRAHYAEQLCAHLDTVASHLPAEKTASVRTLQRAVAAGQTLSMAIKLAYPHLSGEQRGIFAVNLVKSAARAKQAFPNSGNPAMRMIMQHFGIGKAPSAGPARGAMGGATDGALQGALSGPGAPQPAPGIGGALGGAAGGAAAGAAHAVQSMPPATPPMGGM